MRLILKDGVTPEQVGMHVDRATSVLEDTDKALTETLGYLDAATSCIGDNLLGVIAKFKEMHEQVKIMRADFAENVADNIKAELKAMDEVQHEQINL